MQIVQSYLTKNPCYVANKQITVKGLMLHSVGINQPDANVFIRSWNSPDFSSACVHAFIDANSGTVYQTLPWTMRGWHCGRSANNTHIGVEMCEPAGIKYTRGSTFTITGDLSTVRKACETTYNSAVNLFAQLCQQFNLDPMEEGVVISHSEGYKLGVATNHADPEHIWSKASLKLGYTMTEFRSDVASVMKKGLNGSSEKGYPEVPFQVKITQDEVLWIRTGPGVQYPYLEAQKFIPKGVFNIVEVQENFGKLKSGLGWINLKNEAVRIL